MIETRDFPYCCTAKILVNFGESCISEGDNFQVDADIVKAELKNQIYLEKISGKALVVATTNTQQKTANRVLKELGFSHSEWLQKEQHKNTKVRLWYLALN
jgi:hypothetical protein